MNYGHHARKAVDYSIVVALLCIVVVPCWFFLSIGPGMGTEPSDPLTERFAFSLFIFASPGYYTVKLLHLLGLRIGIIDWLVICLTIPGFWGTAFYSLIQLGRLLHRRLTNRSSLYLL